MAGRECYHCKQWIEEGEEHDCWTTTEAALTQDLSEDLRDAWERLRETAVSFGHQRIYASGSCIMFSRESCYFFVRPKRSFLEVCLFLGRALKSPQVRRADRKSKTKFANILKITHRDEVEPPVTDWLQEAYELPDVLAAKAVTKRAKSKPTSGPKKKQAKAARARKSEQREVHEGRKDDYSKHAHLIPASQRVAARQHGARSLCQSAPVEQLQTPSLLTRHRRES